MGGSVGGHFCTYQLTFSSTTSKPISRKHYTQTLVLIQNSPRHTQTLSETHQKYYKLTVYQHSQLKLVFCPQVTHKTLNDTYIEVDIQTQAITWLLNQFHHISANFLI